MAKHIPRIYISTDFSNVVDIDGQDFRHLHSVLRLKIADSVIIFNEQKGEWLSEVLNIWPDKLRVSTKKLLRTYTPYSKVKIAFGVIKHENVRTLVEKCTELGVTDFYPILTEYTNHTLRKDKVLSYIKSATEQCFRLDCPLLHETRKLSDFLNLQKDKLWFSCIERYRASEELIPRNLERECGFIVGPEGGFSEYEKGELKKVTTPISIADNILRSETAAIVCAALCKSFFVFSCR